jgi:transcriptional regulator with XRE-family HTH domain
MKPAPSPLGHRIRTLRLARGLSLAGLARETGVSEATMSRIETGASEVSAPHLYALARHLGTDIASFFAEGGTALRPGARSLTRAGEGQGYASARLQAEVLNGDLLHKRMHPFRNRTTARTLDEAGGLAAHPGEEWLHVLRGILVLHSSDYAPLRLMPGDSLYFDATTPHAYLAETGEGAEFLVLSSAPGPQGSTQT